MPFFGIIAFQHIHRSTFNYENNANLLRERNIYSKSYIHLYNNDGTFS